MENKQHAERMEYIRKGKVNYMNQRKKYEK